MRKQLPLSRPPDKICILRLSALGDVIHVLPVVRAIQERWPDTEITWVCGKFEHKLLSGISGIRFIQFDKKQGWRAYVDLYRQLRHETFDVLLHMQVALRANLASLCISAPIKLGWDRARSRDLHGLFVNHRVPAAKLQHQTLGFLSFAQSLGIEVDQPRWDLPVSDDAVAFADKYIDRNVRTLLISPCSSHQLRNWTVEGYAAVADFAIEKLGMQVILSGGPSELEKDMASAIESKLGNAGRISNLVGKDTLQQLMGLLSRVDVVLSPDSGPAHIANALGTPVIGLYACTWSKRSGPYNSLDFCIDKFETAAITYYQKSADQLFWGTRIEQPGVMALIEPDEVMQMLEKVVAD